MAASSSSSLARTISSFWLWIFMKNQIVKMGECGTTMKETRTYALERNKGLELLHILILSPGVIVRGSSNKQDDFHAGIICLILGQYVLKVCNKYFIMIEDIYQNPQQMPHMNLFPHFGSKYSCSPLFFYLSHGINFHFNSCLCFIRLDCRRHQLRAACQCIHKSRG